MRRKREKADKKRVSNNGETSSSDDAPPPPSPESMLVKQFNSSPMPFAVENGVNGSSPRSPADEEEEGGRNVELRKSVSKRKAWQDKKCVVPPSVVHAVALILGATCSIPGFVEATESAVSLIGIGCPQVGDGPLRAMPHRQALALRGAYGVRPRAREVAGSGGYPTPLGVFVRTPMQFVLDPWLRKFVDPQVRPLEEGRLARELLQRGLPRDREEPARPPALARCVQSAGEQRERERIAV
jgi:hypothetical protein